MRFRSGLLLTTALALVWTGTLTSLDSAAAESGVSNQVARVLLVTGIDYPGHLWRQTAPALQQLLERDPRLQVRQIEDPAALATLPLNEWDVILLHFMNWEQPAPGAAARQSLQDFVRSGKGLMLVHFACGAWQDWPEFKMLVGRVWDPKLRGHDPHGAFRVDIADPKHPIVKGLQPFETVDELYTCLTGDTPIHIVASARSKVDQKDYPMAFVLDYGKGRVFHTVLGHDVRAFTNSAVPELLRRGCAWAAGLTPVVKTEVSVEKRDTMHIRKDPASGQFEIWDGAARVLRYNYQTVEPGDLLAKVHPDNRKYAQARSDYIHPLYGLDGQELTLDWPLDHPHHRGIYWAWPEVEFQGERGDLHALQRVWARPTGTCRFREGPSSAQIDAENTWVWETGQPIVRERAVIRAYTATRQARRIDLEFSFTALHDSVSVARRGTEHYGGLNIRLGSMSDQCITLSPEANGPQPSGPWADLSGSFGGQSPAAGLTILQHRDNPGFPGAWIKYPELSWLQPAFPSAKTRYALVKDRPLVLRYRLVVHRGFQDVQTAVDLWNAYHAQVQSLETTGIWTPFGTTLP